MMTIGQRTMRWARRWAVMSGLLLGLSAALAQSSGAGGEVAALPVDRLKKVLEERLGVPKIDELTRTPAGLYEVRIGTDLLYADPSGNYIFAGSLHDLRTQENLTQRRIDKLTAIDWKDLPLDDAIKIVRGNGGNGKRQIAMFEDPNCGYCRQIHQTLAKMTDMTVYVFLYPILSPDSADKSKQIWCSPNRAQTWLDWMLERKPITAPGNCPTPIERTLALGQKHRINGTPAVFFPDGTRVPGAMSAEQIERRLASLK
jgi:thiol:disulfide interchange protein DsbC